MNIAIIDTGSSRKEYNEPLGISCLLSALRRSFPDFNYFLWCMELDGDVPEEGLTSFAPNVIFFSCKINEFYLLDNLVRYSKKRNPEAIIVLGDVYSTYAYEYVLKKYPDLICIRGEGEGAVVILIQTLIESGHNIASFKKLLSLRNPANFAFVYQNTPFCLPISPVHLGNHPPERPYLNFIIARGGLARIESSRGCSWGKCHFCCVSAKYGGATRRDYPIDYVVAEIIRLSDANVETAFFTDEDFIGNDTIRTLALCSIIKDLKRANRINKKMTFYISTGPYSFFHHKITENERKDLLRILFSSGFLYIFLGLESGSKTQLARYNKNSSVLLNAQCYMRLVSEGFIVDVGFIMFDPYTTISELKENISFIHKYGIYKSGSRLTKSMRVVPNTDLYFSALNDNLITGYDNDDLMYNFRFKDYKMSILHSCFLNYENATLPLAYDIQSKYRTSSGFNSNPELLNCLVKLRKIDISLILKLALLIEKGCDVKHCRAVSDIFINKFIHSIKFND